ncbi:MAG TPA: tRNA (5-methylaminomethyl-2-thiouridine)(34)-methyltransferase MnmD [Chryseolinea sp.]|nr:tRNA (5-methylaminomethyl-2-thiouridine)(34)-methyltransferase MnmD [Chryseolinea sp.]
MASLKIITTSDGSHSLLDEDLQETYHSVHGAIQESNHVFIQSGLQYLLDVKHSHSATVLEIGFGTGLNAWLTMAFARAHEVSIRYVTIEAFPLDESIWSKLNYAEPPMRGEFFRMHQADWEKDVELHPEFHLRKIHGKLEDISIDEAAYDVIFYDAFAPSKQAEMWSLPMLEKSVNGLKAGGVFVTYCAKGQLKRDLRSLNLSTATLPGPPGKKEMVRATKN